MHPYLMALCLALVACIAVSVALPRPKLAVFAGERARSRMRVDLLTDRRWAGTYTIDHDSARLVTAGKPSRGKRGESPKGAPMMLVADSLSEQSAPVRFRLGALTQEKVSDDHQGQANTTADHRRHHARVALDARGGNSRR